MVTEDPCGDAREGKVKDTCDVIAADKVETGLAFGSQGGMSYTGLPLACI